MDGGRVYVVLSSWREDAGVRVPGWGSAHKAVRDLCLARERGAGSGSIARRWSKLSRNLRGKVLEQLVEKEELEIALAVYHAEARNVRIHGHIAALMAKARETVEADAFVAGFDDELGESERVKFRCALLEFYARYGLWERAHREFGELEGLGRAAAAAGRRALFQAQAKFGDPFKAEETLNSIKASGERVSSRSYKSLLVSFGRAAIYGKVDEVLEAMLKAGHKLDAATFNTMLAAYGTHRKYREMLEVMEMMEEARIGLTVLSWNAVSNACPVLAQLTGDAQEPESLLGAADLLSRLDGSDEELELVRKLVTMNLPLGSVDWSAEVWKLDMHSLTPGAAYLTLLCWLDEAKRKFGSGARVPREIEVVTGWGKHSKVEGSSEVKNAVLRCLRSAKSPLKIDRENKGRMLGRGHKLKEWLLASCNACELGTHGSYQL
ncbi:pentatricopeptide repeat-containing protein At2g17033-like [Selaginella moellendorffii]|uniref:pentatricopeptide repeat-containing protein At2g17033-like n=1 Tax=Selaginella moellendorffii TaxID=88036 RepID=UPI000D1CE6B5|nr:pentatricopeptide repeat-containing protein At2g17033-like [Selaginella moellendorffii]|eukprot:XP_024536888.1 pentatricopeptide repeat-containing protein At2g17033-like [Selaginella moellendorffii]